jgi:predicted amidohydrolase
MESSGPYSTIPAMSRIRLRSATAPAVAAVSGSFALDLELSLKRVERTIRDACARGATLIVFPEAALGGYPYEATGAPPALLTRDSEVFDRLARVAGPAVVCIGYTERAADGPFASAVCLSGDGVLGHHRKVHVPPSERPLLRSGDGFAAFDTPLGRLGMLICYDKVFPEAARNLALDGAEIIASMAAWPVCRLRPAPVIRADRQVLHFNALDVARAVENQVVWVSANHYGSLGPLRFPGQAKVVDPDGRVLAATGARAGLALANIDSHAVVRRARDELFHLGDRVARAYGVNVAAHVA